MKMSSKSSTPSSLLGFARRSSIISWQNPLINFIAFFNGFCDVKYIRYGYIPKFLKHSFSPFAIAAGRGCLLRASADWICPILAPNAHRRITSSVNRVSISSKSITAPFSAASPKIAEKSPSAAAECLCSERKKSSLNLPEIARRCALCRSSVVVTRPSRVSGASPALNLSGLGSAFVARMCLMSSGSVMTTQRRLSIQIWNVLP
mmetsp:Transcript_28512/g.71548  ORF Transcript_28512/g.71548 Transcript_28512/m.71548 type:complete len:205 (-) Transcript_28512:358-972(-)